ncbi:DUF1616 domain-containing protein [Actinoplanes derwentensis]|uniref:Uncharacterized protein n=1 Tax=Actinoplanes derwentensis TaxID=113562 RepID=A0A1H1R111_9ACTN|nr:DUF1616 domain-containing protein [Actinoplanes derwentensis]GID87106.1 hypothetical protein Ade03nite_60300 [Actinoplanes derwentensis]SDS28659.1 Protein of unknown function [Actinoplanes derwentensis]
MNPVRAGVLAGLTVVTSAAVEFGPPVLAVPAGLLLAFVLPGQALTEAIIRPGRRDIGVVERIVLVPSLSLAVLVLGGLGLWAVGGHLNRTSWMLVCSVTAMIGVGVAFYRLQHATPEPAPSGEQPRFVFTQERLVKDVLPLTLAVLLLGVAGVWSFADSVNTYDVRVTSLSAAAPGPVDAEGNRVVQVTADGLEAASGPYRMILTGTTGRQLSRHDIAPDTDGDWTGRITVPSDQRVTVNLFRGAEVEAFRTLIIAAVS